MDFSQQTEGDLATLVDPESATQSLQLLRDTEQALCSAKVVDDVKQILANGKMKLTAIYAAVRDESRNHDFYRVAGALGELETNRLRQIRQSNAS